MSNKKTKKFRGYLIAAAVVAGLLILGYATGNEDRIEKILLAVGLILVAITILVTIHELGHFLTARMFGMRVDAFSIGFPPKIFGIKKGDTEYQIGATPLGGYVKIAGMIDESFDTEFVGQPPKPYEFRSKPIWQRMIVMLGGVVMNVLLGILIFSMLKFHDGDTFLPREVVNKEGIMVPDNSIGSELGFKTGDKLLTVNGEVYPYLSDYLNRSVLQQEGYYEVERNNEKVRIEIPSTAINYFSDKKPKEGEKRINPSLFGPWMPCAIEVDDPRIKESPVRDAGIVSGDIVTSIEGQEIKDYDELLAYLGNKEKNFANKQIELTFKRDEESIAKTITLTEDGRIGVLPLSPKKYFEKDLIEIEYSFTQSFGPGTREAFGIVGDQAIGMSRMVDSEVETSSLVKGPIQIAGFYADIVLRDGLGGFIRITGVLSMILALMNILPIPALDGGHLMFLIYEAITRREPSVKVKLIAQQVGLILVLCLMAFVLFNDAFQMIFG